MFFTLVVACPDLRQHPPGAPPSTFPTVDGLPSTFPSIDDVLFQISSSGTSQGPIVNVFYVDGGRSRISVSTSQGARCRHFLALVLGAPESPALTPPRGSTVNVFYVDGGHSRISVSTHQWAHHQRFFLLMVGALGSPAPPPRGPTADVLQLCGSSFHTSGNASQGSL
jgi:hypothetical protein